MTSETDVRAVAREVWSLVRPRLVGARFSYYWNNTWLFIVFNHAKDVASLLIDEFGCDDPAAFVSAVMGDVNYQQCMSQWLIELHSLPGPQHLAPLPRAGCQVQPDRRSRLTQPHDIWPERAQY